MGRLSEGQRSRQDLSGLSLARIRQLRSMGGITVREADRLIFVIVDRWVATIREIRSLPER